jgi:hypothetical protein
MHAAVITADMSEFQPTSRGIIGALGHVGCVAVHVDLKLKTFEFSRYKGTFIHCD